MHNILNDGPSYPVPSLLADFRQAGTMKDRVRIGALCSEIIDSLAPKAQLPTDTQRAEAAQFFIRLVSSQPKFHPISEDWPPWLDHHTHSRLVNELRQQGVGMLKGRSNLNYVRCGMEALRLSYDKAFNNWIRARTGLHFSDHIKLTYIVYTREGDYCRFHLDDPSSYEFNCLIGLEHRWGAQPQSHLAYFSEAGDLRTMFIVPGRAVLLHSSAMVHGRPPLPAGEHVSLLSLGLNLRRL